MIKKLINGKAKSITAAAIVLGTATLASKLLGVLRNRILVGEISVGNEFDIYLAAFRIPDFIFNIVVFGALSAGFIPVFSKLIFKGKEDRAFRTANAALNIVFILLIILCFSAVIFTKDLVDFIAPGFDGSKKEMTIELTRIMLLSPIFLLLSSILGGILQSFKRFFVYSLSPIMYNVGIIIGAVYFVNWWGLPGLAWGVVLGSFLHFAIQISTVRKLGFKYQFIVDTKNTDVKKMARMITPRLLTIIATQFNLVIITIIASTLAIGSLTIFTLANDLQSFPLGLFAISFAVASFPTLSALSDKENREKFIASLSSTAKQILFFIIPISVLLFVLRAQVVRVALGTRNFTWEDTILTFNALGVFVFSLFAQALIPLLARSFWALHDAKTPFITSLISVFINILLAFSLSKEYGVIGLAMAFSISSVINALFLYCLINKKIGFSCHKAIFKSVVKISCSSAVAGLFAYKSLYLIEPFLDTHTFVGIFTQGLFAGLVGIVVYCLISWKFKIEEFIIFKNSIRKRIFKTKIETVEIIKEE
ncbi:MAG: murein biosynthesis integral membrane protein MurJ [Patescibacteria group bacterium]|nr:murein biosynthesis integral membrane protein MurJ [Patescibacteria group bacterium]